MLLRWPIRVKLLVGLSLLVVMVSTSAGSGFLGLYAYRGLVKSLGWRFSVLPLASQLAARVSDLRVAARGDSPFEEFRPADDHQWLLDAALAREAFRLQLERVVDTLARYRQQLAQGEEHDTRIKSTGQEWQNVRAIEASLRSIERLDRAEMWALDDASLAHLNSELDTLQRLSGELPDALYQNVERYAQEVRAEYRALIIVAWTAAVLAALMLGLYATLFYYWIFRPLRVLVAGSRRVAGGQFDYRISLTTQDEMAELAGAMNDMTARFRAIRDDLDQQVRERTKEVVRSEQLASVGFLAAGVAHEINNPLASIALCAESLEPRVTALLPADGNVDRQVIHDYLRMIQTEAFRCKEITEKLLDFSRLGDAPRQRTELRAVVQDVLELVGHLGRYHEKHLELVALDPVFVSANTQELKQVVLNLVTNALDSLEAGGTVRIEVLDRGNAAELVVEDNGCGMTPEVLKHLFEPFFTRRRGGQGTGLGLSITYRIVADHAGHIEATSAGPGRGSRFVVRLPLAEPHQENHHRYQAA